MAIYAPTPAIRLVLRIDRSPLNPKVWCIQLECGHEAWHTGRKPTRRVSFCERCTYARATNATG